jgi:uncharacterized protein YndB with AHSA1/START domain
MSTSANDGVEIVREFSAAPREVFRAWTTAEHFARWFGGDGVDVPASSLNYEPVEGGTWAATMLLPDGSNIDWTGDFVQVTPPGRFVFTMTDDASSPERATVTVDLASADGGTRMQFMQDTPGFSPEQKEATIAGWQTFFDVLAADLPDVRNS